MKEVNELNSKVLIISFIIAICIVYGMFSDNDFTGMISWIIMVTILIFATVALVAWIIYDNKNVIINYIKNMFR